MRHAKVWVARPSPAHRIIEHNRREAEHHEPDARGVELLKEFGARGGDRGNQAKPEKLSWAPKLKGGGGLADAVSRA